MQKKAPVIDGTLDAENLEPKLEEISPVPKVNIDPEESDREALEYIMGDIEHRLHVEYAQVFSMENQLLAKVRSQVPEYLGGGYAKAQDGSYIEDWGRLSTQDMEQFILSGSSEAFFASQRVINQFAEAAYAKYDYDDAYDDAYARMLTGTIGDKTAKAKRKTQKERWVALYKSIYYKKCKELVDRLDAHVRRMERVYSERKKEIERQFRASRSNV